jgi:hypothetical protein
VLEGLAFEVDYGALATTIAFAIVALVRLWARFRRPQPQRAIRTALVGAALVALVFLFQTGERGAREGSVGRICTSGSMRVAKGPSIPRRSFVPPRALTIRA